MRKGEISPRMAAQRQLIERWLKERPMTVLELAPLLGVSHDTVRNRIRELREARRPVRIVDWQVLETTMVRVWGIGQEADAPRPVRVQVTGRRRQPVARVKAPAAVRFRREALDEWLFRVRGLQ